MRQSLRESLILILGIVTAAVFLLMIFAAAFLTPEGGSVRRAIGGAIVVTIAPFFLGMLVAFVGSLKPKGDDVFSKTAGILIGLIIGISIAQIAHMSGKIIALVDGAASDFSMSPSLLWLMLPVSFTPGLLIMYDVYHSEAGTIVGWLRDFLWVSDALKESKGLQKVIAGDLKGPEKKRSDKRGTELKKAATALATTYFTAGDYSTALAVIENAQPESGTEKDDHLFVLGAALGKLEKGDEALTRLGEIKDKSRFEPGLSKLMGEICVETGSFKAAVEHLNSYKFQVGKPDAETVRLLLTAFEGWYGEEPSPALQQKIVERAQDFIGEVTGTGIISKGEVKELWPGLLEEEGEE